MIKASDLSCCFASRESCLIASSERRKVFEIFAIIKLFICITLSNFVRRKDNIKMGFSKTADYRKFLLKKYGHLYRRDFKFNQEICCYCGERAGCYDHRPAIANCPNMSIKDFLKRGNKFLLIPSCLQCNSLLGSSYFSEILDCLFYLLNKYQKKIKKISCLDGK